MAEDEALEPAERWNHDFNDRSVTNLRFYASWSESISLEQARSWWVRNTIHYRSIRSKTGETNPSKPRFGWKNCKIKTNHVKVNASESSRARPKPTLPKLETLKKVEWGWSPLQGQAKRSVWGHHWHSDWVRSLHSERGRKRSIRKCGVSRGTRGPMLDHSFISFSSFSPMTNTSRYIPLF